MKNNEFTGAILATLVVVIYGIMFHAINVKPHDWEAVFMWLPIYALPIWIIAVCTWLSEKKKEKNKL